MWTQTRKCRRWSLLLLIAPALLGAAALHEAQSTLAAPPPGKGKDGGGSVPPGVIYFATSGPTCWSMLGDGSDKRAEECLVPSRQLHGGSVWFLEAREIPGEFYPDGDPRQELFVVREDGSGTVQLTNQANLELMPKFSPWDGLEWSPEDAWVSWIGLEWVDTNSDGNLDTVVKAGIYGAPVDFDATGNINGLVAQPDPSSPLVTAPIFEWDDADGDGIRDQYTADVHVHSWSPDGTMIVHDANNVITISDLATGQSLPLADGSHPAWAPDGTRIAYAGADGLNTITPSGAEETQLVPHQRAKSFRRVAVYPRWSPDSQFLIYEWNDVSYKTLTAKVDVHRITRTGENDKNLTSDIGGGAPIGWR